MNVEQIFYGRGENGYAILGSSIPLCGLTDQVLELCQSIGTPGFEREDDNQPFLLQKVCGPNVLMACGRNGEPDSLGRKTLFFHVVAVPFSFAKEKRISAADLYRAGVFSEKCLDGKLSALSLNHVQASAGGSPSGGFELPAVFRCRRAENLELVKLLGGALVDTNWATMSWSVLRGFDWYGLDESCSVASVPMTHTVYDSDGTLFRANAKGAGGSHAAPSSPETVPSLKSPRNSEMKKGVCFAVGGLLVGFSLGLVPGRNAEPRNGERVIVESRESKEEIENRVREEVRSQLEKELRASIASELATEQKENVQETNPLPSFDERWRITNFKKEMRVDGTYQSAMIDNPGDPTLKAERGLFKKLEYYVDFVNGHFGCKQGDKQKERK